MSDQHAIADQTELDALRSTRFEPTAEAADRGGFGTAAHGLAADPRLAMGASAVPILHSLQRQVGNRAVMERLGVQRVHVQRQSLEDFGLGDPGSGGGGGPTGGGSGGGTQVISGDVIELDAGSIVLNAPLTRVNGVLQSDTLITDSVIASTYTPGAGNVF